MPVRSTAARLTCCKTSGSAGYSLESSAVRQQQGCQDLILYLTCNEDGRISLLAIKVDRMHYVDPIQEHKTDELGTVGLVVA
eukprot:1869909-Rhodomonas_salina.2